MSSDSPFLTAAEAAQYLRYRSVSAIRTAVYRGRLVPAGRRPDGALLPFASGILPMVALR